MSRAARRLAAAAFAVAVATTLAASAGPAAAATTEQARLERAILTQVDGARAAAGLGALRPSGALARAAAAHSGDMAVNGFFGHASANGGSWSARLRRFTRARSIGETIALMRGRVRAALARRVVRAWLRSPPHRVVLLGHGFHRLGVAARPGRPGGGRAVYVTADFSS